MVYLSMRKLQNTLIKTQNMLEPRKKIVSVSELTHSIKDLLENNYRFIAIRGEVSNLRTPYSGHSYFTLKDDSAQIRAVIFKNQKRYLIKPIKDGTTIICHGRISLYEPRGEYQIIIDTVDEDGHGALQLKFEALKQRLASKGYFDNAIKKDIPTFPEEIAIITSATGAAFQDFLKIYQQRESTARIQLVPVRVQGLEAANEIAEAIQKINKKTTADVIVLCRGGGSIEDLWCFNEEIVADAIYKSTIPILTGIGHETDTTMADFCSDYRVATPTGAAEHLLFDSRLLREQINSQKSRLIKSILQTISTHETQLQHIIKSICRTSSHLIEKNQFRVDLTKSYLEKSIFDVFSLKKTKLAANTAKLNKQAPLHKIDLNQQHLAYLKKRLKQQILRTLENKTEQLGRQSALLNSVSPLNTLSRGYSVVFDSKRNIIADSKKIAIGDDISIRLSKGQLYCKITDKE